MGPLGKRVGSLRGKGCRKTCRILIFSLLCSHLYRQEICGFYVRITLFLSIKSNKAFSEQVSWWSQWVTAQNVLRCQGNMRIFLTPESEWG